MNTIPRRPEGTIPLPAPADFAIDGTTGSNEIDLTIRMADADAEDGFTAAIRIVGRRVGEHLHLHALGGDGDAGSLVVLQRVTKRR